MLKTNEWSSMRVDMNERHLCYDGPKTARMRGYFRDSVSGFRFQCRFGQIFYCKILSKLGKSEAF